MMSVDRLDRWDRHFGGQGLDRAADDLWMVVKRLDEVEDALLWAVRFLAGCPNEAVENDLRVAKDCVQDSFEELRTTVRTIRAAVAEQAS